MESMRESWTDKRLDEFAIATERRFDAIDHRFDRVEGRLDLVDERLVGLDQRLEKVEESLHSFQRIFIQAMVGLTSIVAAGFVGLSVAIAAT